MSALLGIDVGTSSLKSSIYDVEGAILGSAIESYPTLHIQPTWGEHDPNRWWSALKDTFAQALKQSHVSPDDIAGIGIDCVSPSFVPVDSKSNALRNAFIPLDVRSKSEVAEINNRISAEELFEISGNRLATGNFRYFTRQTSRIMRIDGGA